MARCIAAQHDLHIFSRDSRKAKRLQEEHFPSAAVCDSVADLATSVDVLVASLSSLEASKNVIIEQAVPAAKLGTVLVDTSTVTRQLSLDCEAAASNSNLHFLDAPVSGGPTKAADGTLSVMVGGKQDAFDKAKAVLDCMGNVFHMGGPGTGTAAKLINQLLVGVHSAAACEALLLAEQLGIKVCRLPTRLAFPEPCGMGAYVLFACMQLVSAAPQHMYAMQQCSTASGHLTHNAWQRSDVNKCRTEASCCRC